MPPRLTSLAQTQAIVAQVGREIEQQAIRQGQQSNPRSASTGAAPIPFRAAARPLSTARRFVLALLPTTL